MDHYDIMHGLRAEMAPWGGRGECSVDLSSGVTLELGETAGFLKENHHPSADRHPVHPPRPLSELQRLPATYDYIISALEESMMRWVPAMCAGSHLREKEVNVCSPFPRQK